MKVYQQLTPEQQKKAREIQLKGLLEAVCEGFVDWLPDDVQAKIEEAGRKAEAMRTPWFLSEYVMDTCRKEFEEIAEQEAQMAVYAEAGDPQIVRGVV